MPKSRRLFLPRRRRRPSLATGLGVLAGTAAGLAGGWILYSRFRIDHQAPLPPAVDAERQFFFSDESGRISYYVDRHAEGRPLVFVHSINAGASAYDLSPLFETFRNQRPVYALDLPGFGFSERSPRHYSPQLYADTIQEFLRTQVRSDADVVALSLGGEFAARAAVQSPALFHSLTLISPTGLGPTDGRERGSQQAAESGASPGLYKAFSFPLWAQAFFDLIATRPSIRYFLQQSFIGEVPEEFVDYAYATTHQPGAHYAPLYFISGMLFTPDVRRKYYDPLTVPTLILYDRDAFTRFDQLPALVQGSQWIEAARIVNTLGLPHFEKREETAREIERFWASIPERAASE